MTRKIKGALLAGILAVAAGACDGSPTGSGSGTCAPGLEGAAQVVDSAVRADAREGGLLLVMRGDQVLCERAFGGYAVNERVELASASKWVTAATLLTLVDAGTITLDQPIGPLLPIFAADGRGPTTFRQLLSHTSGIGNPPCLGSRKGTLLDCAGLAAQYVTAPPGTEFRYAGGSFTVAGAAAEIAAGQDWAAIWKVRMSDPLGLQNARWDDDGNPYLSGGMTSTMQDYARFLRMVLGGGMIGGQRVLSAASVEAMRRDHVGALPVAGTPTTVARYGLGSWIEAADASGRATRLSSPGASGFYPWVDFDRNLAVIVMLPVRRVSDDWGTAAGRVRAEILRAIDAGL
jgi:CubicO group peptidase (beta-lactamase class C family)